MRTVKKLGAEKIEEAERGGEHAGEYMVLNTEWGAMDNKVGSPLDPVDASVRPYPYPSLTTSWTARASTREHVDRLY